MFNSYLFICCFLFVHFCFLFVDFLLVLCCSAYFQFLAFCIECMMGAQTGFQTRTQQIVNNHQIEAHHNDNHCLACNYDYNGFRYDTMVNTVYCSDKNFENYVKW